MRSTYFLCSIPEFSLQRFKNGGRRLSSNLIEPKNNCIHLNSDSFMAESHNTRSHLRRIPERITFEA